MYALIQELTGPMVGVRVQGDINDRENRRLVRLVEERFAQFGPVRLLVVYEADPGLMGAEGLCDNLRFARQMGGKLARLAVVGEHDWESTWVGLFGLLGGIRTHYFDRAQAAAAVAWLNA